jgi:hypothetical protein
MKRLSFWLTVLAGGVAAYLMFKRGESLPNIAKNAMTNPIGAFAHEVKEAL